MAGKRIRQNAGKRGGRRRTSWKPGTSGNPKGRIPLPADYKLAMEDLGPRGLQALSNIVDDPAHPNHAAVAIYAVNQWKGSPKQRTELSGPGGGPIQTKAVLTSDERRERAALLIETARARAAAATAAASSESKATADEQNAADRSD
jgi:hypothetical protein